jgi:hypothetical protein
MRRRFGACPGRGRSSGEWRRYLAAVEDREPSPEAHLSRRVEPYTVEQMLEHAVVHPMRHRIQLERLM